MSLEDDLRNLSRIPIFAAMEPDARRLIAFSAETRILRAGDVLFRRGEPSDGGYVLISGSIVLDDSDDIRAGTELTVPFTLIGEVALISETARSVAAIARHPSTVLKISRTLFHRVLREYPSNAEKIRGMLSARLGTFLGELNKARSEWKT